MAQTKFKLAQRVEWMGNSGVITHIHRKPNQIEVEFSGTQKAIGLFDYEGRILPHGPVTDWPPLQIEENKEGPPDYDIENFFA